MEEQIKNSRFQVITTNNEMIIASIQEEETTDLGIKDKDKETNFKGKDQEHMEGDMVDSKVGETKDVFNTYVQIHTTVNKRRAIIKNKTRGCTSKMSIF